MKALLALTAALLFAFPLFGQKSTLSGPRPPASLRSAETLVSLGSPVLTPGDGTWDGPTSEPSQVGTGTARCIARWDVVPHQTLRAADHMVWEVGVVAFHIAGIEKVSFAIEDGPFVDVHDMSYNPRTETWEYVALIYLPDYVTDEQVELRAIAYPRSAAPGAGTGGYPGGGYCRVLDPLFLYVDAGAPQTENIQHVSTTGSDSTGDGSSGSPFATIYKAAVQADSDGGGDAGGAFIYLDSGSYTWDASAGGSTPDTAERWLTIQANPMVDPATVEIDAGGTYSDRMSINKVRLHNLTLDDVYVHGDDGDGGGPGGDDIVWADVVTCVGSSPNDGQHNGGGWFPGWQERYMTKVDFSNDHSSLPPRTNLARGCTSVDATWAAQRPHLVINCTWDRIGLPENRPPAAHPDVFHWNFAGDYENAIIYGNLATNCEALTMFSKDSDSLTDFAFVNNAFDAQGAGAEWGLNAGDYDHLLWINNTHTGVKFSWERPIGNCSNIAFRGNVFNNVTTANGGGYGTTWFDASHFVTGPTPGTNTSSGSAGLGGVYGLRPQVGSVLLQRMSSIVPVDIEGTLRTTTDATVGAYE